MSVEQETLSGDVCGAGNTQRRCLWSRKHSAAMSVEQEALSGDVCVGGTRTSTLFDRHRVVGERRGLVHILSGQEDPPELPLCTGWIGPGRVWSRCPGWRPAASMARSDSGPEKRLGATSTSAFSDPAGTGQGAALLSQQSSPAAPLAWLDQVRDSPRTSASATLPLQLAPETLSEQKASAPLPSAQSGPPPTLKCLLDPAVGSAENMQPCSTLRASSPVSGTFHLPQVKASSFSFSVFGNTCGPKSKLVVWMWSNFKGRDHSPPRRKEVCTSAL
ncbi:hypothetical protein E5288_WYG003929 [Bos mutus]|uniref:Uncharacterized protein n=1 Tax=Bos mutus TaxID=72004 RepID=A0A6B0S8E2_9CETA|nr:hypothetical protein [Bos mutus]